MNYSCSTAAPKVPRSLKEVFLQATPRNPCAREDAHAMFGGELCSARMCSGHTRLAIMLRCELARQHCQRAAGVPFAAARTMINPLTAAAHA